MRLIDADALIEGRNGCKKDCSKCDFALEGDSWCKGVIYVTQILSAPTVDAVPVVQCREERRQDGKA